MDDESIRLRQPEDETLRAWSEPAAAAFAEEFESDAEFEHARRFWELDRLIGARTRSG
jgi:hypothetical protein